MRLELQLVTAAILMLLAVLFVATAYEIAFALSWVSPGRLPGQGPPGSDLVVVAGLFTLVIGSLVAFLVEARSTLLTVLLACLAPMGGAFVVARFYTFDPYYLPTMRRIADNGVVSEGWVFGLLVLAIVAGVVTWLQPSRGSGLTGLLLFFCAFTTIWQAGGH